MWKNLHQVMNNPYNPQDNKPRLYTLRPVEYDPKLPLTPEFCRMSDLRVLFGITRSMTYLLVNKGKIRSVGLRRSGSLKGVRLVDVANLREFLNSLPEKELKTENQPTAASSRQLTSPRSVLTWIGESSSPLVKLAKTKGEKPTPWERLGGRNSRVEPRLSNCFCRLGEFENACIAFVLVTSIMKQYPDRIRVQGKANVFAIFTSATVELGS
jgi:hypothetical protein